MAAMSDVVLDVTSDSSTLALSMQESKTENAAVCVNVNNQRSETTTDLTDSQPCCPVSKSPNNPVSFSASELSQKELNSDCPQLPNGLVTSHSENMGGGVGFDHGDECAFQDSAGGDRPTEIVSKSSENSSLTIPESCPESSKRPSDLTDSADSGVHSGTENGSDRKSSSSSPGLSTESSIQDLSEKDDVKKCDTSEPIDEDKSRENQLMSDLADSVSNNVSINDIMHEYICDSCEEDYENGIEYLVYESEAQMPDIMRLITKDLSEPYSIYTYRYFIHNWPKLCFLAMDNSECVGAIVCKLDMHKKMVRRGYIAMLAVDQKHRRKRIGSHLVLKAIRAMIADDCDEVVLETEITNQGALRLYEKLGFVRDKRLFRYYLNGVDALRLKLWLR